MKRKFLYLFLLTVFTFLNGQNLSAQKVPPLRLPNAEGKTITLDSLKGKVVLVDFWASWCIPCIYSNRQLKKIYKAYKAKGFEVIGVALDQKNKKWQKMAKKEKYPWLLVWDESGNTAYEWGVFEIPNTFLMDKEGKLIAHNPSKKELERYLKDLLND